MASDSPPSSSDSVKPPAQVSEISQETAEPLKEVSPESVFVNSKPIREDQVQNAIKFLSHPRVRGSPVVHRRNFLERKGLTKEEIDEAFRRVPVSVGIVEPRIPYEDPSPGVTGAHTTTSSQEGQVTPLQNTQLQSSTHPSQPAGAAPLAGSSIFARRFGWSHAFLAVGFLAASGAGTVIIFKKSIVPRLRSWIRRVASDDDQDELKRNTPSLNEEATAAAKAAAAAAADAAKASQELVIMKSEEKKHLEQFTSLMDAQLQEIKSMKTTLWKLEGQNYNSRRSNHVKEEYLNGTIARSRRPTDNGRADYDSLPAMSLAPPVTSEPPHPQSYMEIISMIQRGEKPPNIRDINDAPPNSNQPISNPSLAPKPKPWETAKPTSSSTTSFGSQPLFTGNGASSTVQDLGVAYQFSSESSAPSWQQKSGARITEIENEDLHLRAGSNGEALIEQPPQHKWVPMVSKEQILSESGGVPDLNGDAAENAGSSVEIQEEQVMS